MKKVIEKKIVVGNRFKAQVIERGQVVRETPWVNNLILDKGLNNIATMLIADLFTNCAVGSGNSTPANGQTSLDTEVRRSNTYLTGIGNCGSAIASNVLTHTRTFDFPTELLTVIYKEVGWSNSASPGANLNTRGLFGSPITVNSGQSLRVIYNFTVTITPNTQRTLTAPISGWPARQYTQTAIGDGTPPGSVINSPADVAFLSLDEPFTIISAGTTGLTPGQTYYSGSPVSSQFHVRTTPGGSNIGFASGTVVMLMNAIGKELRYLIGLSAVNLDGTTNSGGFDAAGTCCEPSVDANYIALSPDTSFAFFFNAPVNPNIAANAFSKVYALQAYTNGNFYRDKQSVFLPSDAGSNRNDWLWIILIPSAAAFTAAGYGFRFNHYMQKVNTATLTITLRFSFSR